MPATNKSPIRGKAAGLVLLFGYFMLGCAILMLLDAGWRAYRTTTVNSRWIEVSANIQKCLLGVYHPFVRDGGGTVFSLRCRLSYEFGLRQYEYDLHTTSARTMRMRTAISHWVAQHRPGTMLTIRVNPSDPNEIVVKSELPIHQFGTAREALLTAIVFGVPGFLLRTIGRKLAQVGH